jgi:hypothetical protein
MIVDDSLSLNEAFSVVIPFCCDPCSALGGFLPLAQPAGENPQRVLSGLAQIVQAR